MTTGVMSISCDVFVVESSVMCFIEKVWVRVRLYKVVVSTKQDCELR